MAEDDEHEVLDHESMLFGELLSRLKTGTDREIRKRLQTKRLFVQGGVPSSLVDGG